MAPHNRVFVNYGMLKEDPHHAQIACVDCHGGDPDAVDREIAHNTVVRDPSYPAPGVCADCHDQAEHYRTSLHYNERGKKAPILIRSNPDPQARAEVEKAVDNHCLGCHASCGQCHVSRPMDVGGGLLSFHQFVKKPPMKFTCTACHGSRVGDEYQGKHDGLLPDIHFQANMVCIDCHTGDQMHGDGQLYDNRYEVRNAPSCANCHNKIYSDGAENKETHQSHKDRVSCHVCHSQSYINCFDCHVPKDNAYDRFFTLFLQELDFKIGLNPRQSDLHPETFVTVRRAPVVRTTFDSYTDNGLSRFDELPTRSLATPHNIRRQTEQNKDCNNCHGNRDLFLRAGDVKPENLEANLMVIVPSYMIPKQVEAKESHARQ